MFDINAFYCYNISNMIDTNQNYELSRIKSICSNYFNIEPDIKELILDSAPSSNNTNTTIFETSTDEVYALCLSEKALTLADVKSIMRSMGIKADSFLAPKGDEDYFLKYGQRIYKSVFPAKKLTNEQDIEFYKTLAPYSPALIKVAKINGIIRKYNTNWHQWQKALELNYIKSKVA